MTRRRRTDNTMTRRRRTDNTMTRRRRTDNTMARRRRTDNTMARRRRTDNTMDRRRRTDNTMARRRRTDNTMARRRRTHNTMARRRRTHNTSAKRRRTDNTMAKRKGQKDKQRSTKHTHKAKDRATRTPLRTGVARRCSGRVSSTCSTSGTHRVNIVTNPVISHLYVSPPSRHIFINHWLNIFAINIYFIMFCLSYTTITRD